MSILAFSLWLKQPSAIDDYIQPLTLNKMFSEYVESIAFTNHCKVDYQKFVSLTWKELLKTATAVHYTK